MPGSCSPISITSHPVLRLAGSTHIGSYQGISTAFDRVFAAIRAEASRPSGCYAIYFDDPVQVPAERLRSFAGVGWTGRMPPGLEELVIPAGEAAELVYTGPYAGLSDAYRKLCREWLPASGCQPAGAPFDEYLNDPCTTPPEGLQTRIRQPIRRSRG